MSVTFIFKRDHCASCASYKVNRRIPYSANAKEVRLIGTAKVVMIRSQWLRAVWNVSTVGSNPARSMDVYPHFYILCCVLQIDLAPKEFCQKYLDRGSHCFRS
jgi:hypothetical protein